MRRPSFLVQRVLRGHSRTQQKGVEEYIKNQLQEDIMEDQISLKEYMDPFTGRKNTKA